jgi:hypothetical protein
MAPTPSTNPRPFSIALGLKSPNAELGDAGRLRVRCSGADEFGGEISNHTCTPPQVRIPKSCWDGAS